MTVLKSRSGEYTAMEENNHCETLPSGKLPGTMNAQTYIEKHNHLSTQSDGDKEEENESCGWGAFRPALCQKFRDPKWVLFWLCWAGAIQGMVVNGFVNVGISNIERRFNLSSTESGLIASCYDIASVLCLIPVSYFGGLGSKPRYLGIGILIMGIGSFVFSLPHFTTDLYEVDPGGDELCSVEAVNNTICDIDVSLKNLANYKYVLYLGQLLHGAGAAPLYTLGVTYLDENLPLRSTSFYIGIYYAFAIVGPAIGYLLGGEFLNMYVDVDKMDQGSVTINVNNPRYVGAWWIGFLISGVLAVLVSLPMSGFPNLLPGSSEYKVEKDKEVYKGKIGANEKVVSEEEDVSLKTILKSVKGLVFNPTFMFLNLASASEGNILAGLATFAPKFLEFQFSLPSSTAAFYVGIAAVVCGGSGTFLGGYIVKKWDLHIKSIIKYCLITTLIVLAATLIFLLSCERTLFAGINIEYGQTDRSFSNGDLMNNLTAQCNAGCHCIEEKYNPVCGVDNIMYFSACYAGCNTLVSSGEVERYGNCSCISVNTSDSLQYMAESGKCDTTCTSLPLFMPVFSVVIFLTFLTSMPALSATLRCLPQSERSFGLGIQWIIARCLGSIPGPLLVGYLLDLACVLWQKKCDEEGSCFFYDNQSMSHNILALCIVVKASSSVCFALSLWMYKAPPESSTIDPSLTSSHNTTSMQTVVSTVSDAEQVPDEDKSCEV